MTNRKEVFLYIVVLVVLLLSVWYYTAPRRDKDWYLVCSGKDKDYLVKSDGMPYTRNGFIYVDGDSFITPEPGMTCKPVKGELVRAAIGENGSSQGK